MIKISLILAKIITVNSLVAEKYLVNEGIVVFINTKLNPHKVINVASGTIKILAKTVMGEKILK